MAEIYLVQCTVGEYDAYTYPVAAFRGRERAERFVNKLNKWCVDHGVDPATVRAVIRLDEKQALLERVGSLKCPYDPRFGFDIGGNEYSMVCVPLEPEDNPDGSA